ncbi:MAG: FecR domain-containing protein [Anditalea sp.]
MNSKLIKKFFRKECTPEEAKQVLEWFSRQGVQPWQEDDQLAFWEEAEKDKHDPQFAHDPKELLGLIHQQMGQRPAVPSDMKRNRPLINLSDSWAYTLKVAAVLFIPFIFTWLFLHFTQTEQAIKPPSVVTIETSAGMKRTKMLPDGSKVVLNSRSTISYSTGFSESRREVILVGEAFFEVAKDSLRPFTVHSGNLSTTALGTSFNINYRPSRAITEVSLATGTVQVATKDKTSDLKATKLQPGERLNYDIKEASFNTDHFDALETLAWKEGLLYFKKAGIEQVVQRLEDWYGVEIALEGNTGKVKVQDWTYTGMYENQSLENVLTGISYVKDFSFEMNGKNIKLIFN